MKRKRWDVLEELIEENGYKTFVEIGVKSGRNIHQLLSRFPSLEVWAIDPWVKTAHYDHWADTAFARNEKIFEGLMTKHKKAKVHKLKALSWEVAHTFEDESIDLIFIDGDHSYEACRKDIELYLPKVRPGGILAGHDYDNTVKYADKFKGVDKAVHEFFGDEFSLDVDHVWYVRV